MRSYIKELHTKEEMLEAFPLVNLMYEKMDKAEFSSALDEMIALSNYRMIAVFSSGDEMIGVSGYWVASMLYCGLYLQASNIVVAKEFRNRGLGKKILNYLEEKARKLNCKKIVLDSYTENKKSHPLYFRENFYIRGFHFMKDL
jgi:GNAT superfamily N-acetyltransferase